MAASTADASAVVRLVDFLFFGFFTVSDSVEMALMKDQAMKSIRIMKGKETTKETV